VKKLEYKGWYEEVNEPPKDDEWIEVFVSDYNIQCWAFYAYIGLKTFREDIEAICNIEPFKSWLGDTYVELVDCSKGIEPFYRYLYAKGYYTHHNALDPEEWEKYVNGKIMFFELEGRDKIVWRPNPKEDPLIHIYIAKDRFIVEIPELSESLIFERYKEVVDFITERYGDNNLLVFDRDNTIGRIQAEKQRCVLIIR